MDTPTPIPGSDRMQGDARAPLSDFARREAAPPCGDAASCVCRRDDRVTIADMERMAEALGMRLSDLLP